LLSITEQHPRFSQPKLLKIDTDGCDFFIIRNSLPFLADARPVVFFEYYLEGSADAELQGLAAIEMLAAIGYNKHLIYDNFGNFLISVEAPQRFSELNCYLKSNRKHGTAVHYFDVCSFSDEDADLCEQIRDSELTSIAAA
jgi:hypothetical protein